MNQRPLQRVLLLSFGLVAVLPVLVLVVGLGLMLRASAAESSRQRAQQTLEGIRREIERLRDDAERKIQIVSDSTELKRAVLQAQTQEDDPLPIIDEATRLLEIAGLDGLEIVSASGRVLARAHDRARYGMDRSAETRIASSLEGRGSAGIFPDEFEGEPVLCVGPTVPIRHAGRVIGSASGGHFLDRRFAARLRAVSGAEVFLIAPVKGAGTGGAMLVSTVPNLASEDKAAISAGPSGSVQQISSRPFRLQRLETEGLRLVLATSEEAGARVLRQIVFSALLVAAVAIGLATLASIVLARQIASPILALAGQVSRLAEGGAPPPRVQLPAQSSREVSVLSSSFNRLTDELRDRETKLLAAERQSAWSLMARKVAHEIKNPLTPIQISVEDLKRSYRDRRKGFAKILDACTKTILEEVQTLKRIVSEFSEFGRLPKPAMVPTDLNDLATRAATLVAKGFPESEVTFALDSAVPGVSADPDLLSRLVGNLVKNGIEAMGGKGRLSIESVRVGDTARLRVRDQGPGLSDEARDRLFSPLFTTKTGGTGLGLVISQRIAAEHGGTLTLANHSDGGCVAELSLPILPGAALARRSGRSRG